ncbi:hypothetical protein DSECCO2_485070 [anaerobic digester metagenome]
MGFYFRKSINFGGVRFNFSKSGIGTSVGVKGFRVGANSRGNYIHIGRGGLYYRAAIGKKKSSYRGTPSQSPSSTQVQRPLSPQVPQAELHFQKIDSSDLAFIVDSSSQEVVNEINAKRKKSPFWPLALLLTFVPGAGIPLAMLAAILLAILVDKKRKTTVLVYDIDEDTEQEIQSFYNAFDELVGCSAAWHVSSQASVYDKKYHAGANQLVKRASVRISYKTLEYLKTNVKVPAIPVGSQTIYFFPDRILIYDKKSVGGLAYGSFSVMQRSQRFIESGVVPRDGTVVGHTWQYVNKSGGPDRRFSNNRQLPILLYSEVLFASNHGLNELVQFSKQAAGADLISKLEQYKKSAFLSGDVPLQSLEAVPSETYRTVDETIQNYIRTTPKEELLAMANIQTLVELLKRVFPDEEFTNENITKCLRRLAIKDVRQNDEHFAPVQPSQENQGGRYASEKIVPNPSAKGKQAEPYATFRKMKQVGGHYGEYASYYSGDAETFCKQALFMKDFTDHYSEIVPLDVYCTTYGKMNDAQLRTYFTWRTKVRQGIVENVPSSYAFCYIFELLNDIGVNSPDDAIEKLIDLWAVFRQFDDNLDRYLRTWIRDYYVAHKTQLSIEFSEYSHRFPVSYHGDDIELLARAKSCAWDDLRVIEASSSFKITNGQFYKAGNQEIIEQCACFTIREIAKAFKSGGVDFRKLFFENRREQVYSLYQGAVHLNVDASPIVVALDDFKTMKYNRRGWYREYASITQYRPVIGYILKLIEVKMRQGFGYKRNLQVPNISVVENSFLNSEPEKFNWPNRPTLDKLKEWKAKAFAVISSDSFESIIVRAISDYCKTAHIVIQDGTVRIVKPVEIDMSKLKDIERDHIETAEKLILEESPVPQPDVPVSVSAAAVAAPEVKGMAGLCTSLSADGQNLLRILIEGGQVPPNSELLIETINETALEAIDDNLIDYAEGMPYVYDDYTDDLRSALGGQ